MTWADYFPFVRNAFAEEQVVLRRRDDVQRHADLDGIEWPIRITIPNPKHPINLPMQQHPATPEISSAKDIANKGITQMAGMSISVFTQPSNG